MEYYGFTEKQFDKILSMLNQVSVYGISQNDAFHEATTILRHPAKINVDQEEVKKDA